MDKVARSLYKRMHMDQCLKIDLNQQDATLHSTHPVERALINGVLTPFEVLKYTSLKYVA